MHVATESDPLQVPNGPALRLVLDGLTRPVGDGESGIQPALALHWASESNDHRWQFWLRSGVTFHDGSPLNGLAVLNSLNQSCRMTACPWSGLHVVGQSVVFTGESIMPNLPELLARPEFLIREILSPDSQAAKSLIGTGPFRVKEATSTSLRLEANNDCWQARPFAEAVEFSIHHANRDQWAELSLGKTDLIEIPPSDIRAARQQQLRVIETAAVTLLALEVNNPGLAPPLRAAIALSVDRAVLQQVIFQKQAEITASLLPASLSGYSFLFRIERDLPGALALRGGLTSTALTLAVDGSGPMQLASQRIALNLHDAGFTVKVVPLLTGVNATQRADLVLRSLPVAGDTPASALEWILHSLGMNTPVAATEPVVAFKAEHDFLEQHTVIPLLFLPRAWAVSSRLRDLHLEADGLPDLANASLTIATPTAPAAERTP
jgi:peptide/nickel transport system substrate-binding protein